MSQVYLLAAGKGLRAGGPKAWLEHEGRPLLERQLEFLLGLFAPQDVAVSIQDAWRARCAAINPAVRWVAVNPEAAPMGAFLALLKAAPLSDWGFLYHVDMPVWEKGLFETLSARARQDGPACDAVVPSCQGRKGHPVLLSPKNKAALSALDPAHDRLDFWLRSREAATVEVPYACVLENWNLPAQAK